MLNSNKYIYVGIISALGLGLIILLFLVFTKSNNIEGEWRFAINPTTIGIQNTKDLSKEEILELKTMMANWVESQTYSFEDGNIYINDEHISTWTTSGDELYIQPIIDSTKIQELSPQMSPWNYSKKSTWVVDFKNDSMMLWQSEKDSSLVLTFKRRAKK